MSHKDHYVKSSGLGDMDKLEATGRRETSETLPSKVGLFALQPHRDPFRN
jgi:hypothetical protein